MDESLTAALSTAQDNAELALLEADQSPIGDDSVAPSISLTPSLQQLYDLMLGIGQKCDKLEANHALFVAWTKQNAVALQQNSAQVKLGMNRLITPVDSVDHSDEIQGILTNQTEMTAIINKLLY